MSNVIHVNFGCDCDDISNGLMHLDAALGYFMSVKDVELRRKLEIYAHHALIACERTLGIIEE